jgi:hypothetical protein
MFGRTKERGALNAMALVEGYMGEDWNSPETIAFLLGEGDDASLAADLVSNWLPLVSSVEDGRWSRRKVGSPSRADLTFAFARYRAEKS